MVEKEEKKRSNVDKIILGCIVAALVVASFGAGYQYHSREMAKEQSQLEEAFNQLDKLRNTHFNTTVGGSLPPTRKP